MSDRHERRVAQHGLHTRARWRATWIVKSMSEFRCQLPEKYKWYFGVTGILLLRALFNNKELEYLQRHKALLNASPLPRHIRA